MASSTNNALFYPADFAKLSLQSLVLGTEEPRALDTVEFDKEKGGEAVRQLAIPRLAGMDEVEIELAQMQIRAAARPIEISDFNVQPGPGNKGVFLSLNKPGRLLKVSLEYVVPKPLEATVHLVVRAAQKRGSTPVEGVPLFSFPDFDPPKMFPRTFTGMSLAKLKENRFLITLPSVLGDAWLIQLATGNEPTKLDATDIRITIHGVTLDSVPSNVSVVLVTAAAEVPLWGNPQMLLPSDDVQDITFTPLAQKELATALTTAGSQELTLPLTIKFRSDTAGALKIVSKTLRGRYVVRALKQTPTSLRLSGSQVPLVLSAPAGVRPESASFRIVAKLKGWELNNASDESQVNAPSRGMRVTQVSKIAQKVQFTGRLPLVNVRLLLATENPAEAVVELHEDANGGPAALAGKAIVKQLVAGLRKWVDFELKAPLTFSTDSTSLWVTLHVTKGEVLWFASGATSETVVSTDGGASWSTPEARLASPKAQAVQLFHDRTPPKVHDRPQQFARPVIRVDRAGSPIMTDLMTNAQTLSTKEFVAQNFAPPATVTSFFSQQPGKERVDQTLQLFSTSVLDLQVESASFFYDPFQTGTLGD